MKKLLLIFIVMVVFPAWVVADEEEKARIVTFKSNPVKCLAAIAITQIDGRQRMLPQTGFKIEPGEHTMHGRYTVDLKNCTPVESRNRKQVHVPPLDWFFEPGKTYYVGLDYSAPKREEWRIVVWKVLDADGEVVFDTTKKN